MLSSPAFHCFLPHRSKYFSQRHSVVQHWTTSWMIGVLGFNSWRGLGNFLFTTASRTVLRPTQPPSQWVPRALSLGVKRPGRETDNSPPSSAEVNNAWSYTSNSPICLHGVYSVKRRHRDNFTFAFTLLFSQIPLICVLPVVRKKIIISARNMCTCYFSYISSSYYRRDGSEVNC
jgi:hypothetical protein